MPRFSALLALACLAGGLCLGAKLARGASPAQLLDYLETRVRENPQDPSAWRMLGRLRAQAGDHEQAGLALEQAVKLDPSHVAANFDWGECLLKFNRAHEAAERFEAVLRLAPESEYGRLAQEHLSRLPPEMVESARNRGAPEGEVLPAGYEIKRFDSADQTEQALSFRPPATPRSAYNLRVEVGALYNTNVALTPTSREFFAGSAASYQGFLSPEFEYRIVDGDAWCAGPRFVGYFSLNEGSFSQLNLQSYQGAFFVERSAPLPTAVLAPRAQYVYTHDEFQGVTFGNRHALTFSTTSFWDNGNISVAYLLGDYTNFADDGADPAASSRDGFNAAVGASHTHLLATRFVRALTGGLEWQYADTIGTNFAFASFSLRGEVEFTLAENWSAVLEGGWGYRDYFEAALVPSRNEHVWLAGARVRRFFSPQWSVALVTSYNRFDSANTFFEADRWVGGIVSIHEY